VVRPASLAARHDSLGKSTVHPIWRCLGLVVWSGLVSLACGCGQSPLVPMTAEQTAAAMAEFHSTSVALQDRFRSTPHGSNSELGGHVMEVTGTVALVGISPELGDVILLSGGAKGNKPVICQMAESRPWDLVAPGLPVTIKGQVWRIQPGSAPLLLQSHLVGYDSEIATSMRFTSEDVCASFAENRTAAHDLLGDRWIRVTGEVASIDRINGWLYVSGGSGRLVRCALAGRDGELSWDDSLSTGELIEVVGQVMDGDRLQVILQGCLPPRRNLAKSAGLAAPVTRDGLIPRHEVFSLMTERN
jgi:hypothetical protein